MVLDVSYSRVLGQRSTFYCPLFFLRKTGNSPQAIRRNRLRCFHVWFVSDRWQWVAPRFGRVCTGSLLVIPKSEVMWYIATIISESTIVVRDSITYLATCQFFVLVLHAQSRNNTLVCVCEERLECAQLPVMDVGSHDVRYAEDDNIRQHLRQKHTIAQCEYIRS